MDGAQRKSQVHIRRAAP